MYNLKLYAVKIIIQNYYTTGGIKVLPEIDSISHLFVKNEKKYSNINIDFRVILISRCNYCF